MLCYDVEQREMTENEYFRVSIENLDLEYFRHSDIRSPWII